MDFSFLVQLKTIGLAWQYRSLPFRLIIKTVEEFNILGGSATAIAKLKRKLFKKVL